MSSTAHDHPRDTVAARFAAFSERLVGIERRQAALDAETAQLLAEAAAYADLTVESVVPVGTPPAEARALARRSICAMLAMAVRTPEQTMQRRITDAEALIDQAPAALDSLMSGRISAAHTRVITDQLRDLPVEARASLLAQLLPVAERTTAARLKQRARTLRERVHPTSIQVRVARAETGRRVEMEPATDGMAWLHLFTTATIAQGVSERLDAIATAAQVLGDDRTLAQLRADALSELAVSGTTAPAASTTSGAGTTESGTPLAAELVARHVAVEASMHATVQVTVPALTLLGVEDAPGSLDGYGPIDPDTAARLAVSAPTMIRVLTHPETGAVLSVGRDRYRVPADLQRVVRLRDATCRAPGCNRRARACDLDHSVAWDAGGTTSVGNLACLCRHHHRMKHLTGWDLDHEAGGSLTWTSPDGRTHHTEPDPGSWPPPVGPMTRQFAAPRG
ncbi:MAG TPA: DUF222 domain-containing protein [Plantibacter sp.]|uniref:HNH endonuclease signature motif containing protein n=1 Tax=unclassified Plantibacter TaxID=2624265 RepID=UPI002CB21CD7|nr:DUF222 domain-containing protein [Plantibacter sp.]